MDSTAPQAGGSALTLLDANACFMTGTKGAVATPTNHVAPRLRHRSALAPACPTEVIKQDRDQRVLERAFEEALRQQVDGVICSLTPLTGAPTLPS
jgi:hypothetical protein